VPEPGAAAAVLSASQRNDAAGSAMNNIIYLVGLVVVVLAVLAFFGLR
jgi:cytochrome c biogenesis protein CcdA